MFQSIKIIGDNIHNGVCGIFVFIFEDCKLITHSKITIVCYDVASGTRLALKYAKHRGDDASIIAKLEQELALWVKSADTHHYVSGFAHPKLMVFTNDKPFEAQFFQWGLIPSWVKLKSAAKTLQNQTLNARAETIFDKPAFRHAAKERRCLIYVDAFYEHHHYKGKTYPFHISMKDESPLCLAGLWDEWVDMETGEVINTVAIVTTKANMMMAKIHNSPKLAEARMPVILPKEVQNEWLTACNTEEDKNKLLALLQPLDDALLNYHTVHRLKGKEAIGDVAEAEKEFVYAELVF